MVAGLNYGEKGDAYDDAVGAIIGGSRSEFLNSRNIYCKNVTVADNYFDCGAYDGNGELIKRDVLEAPTSLRAVGLYPCCYSTSTCFWISGIYISARFRHTPFCNKQ